jgi:N-hydroxyarylamine O-acetyltransferase
MIPRYLQRIGLPGVAALTPSVELLSTLMLAHVKSIPFENLSVLAWQPVVPLDMPALIDKIIVNQRGGCCFEQNILLAAVLKLVGFDVQLHKAMMRLHLKDRAQVSDRAHLMLIVTLDNEKWIVDVALGSLSMSGE